MGTVNLKIRGRWLAAIENGRLPVVGALRAGAILGLGAAIKKMLGFANENARRHVVTRGILGVVSSFAMLATLDVARSEDAPPKLDLKSAESVVAKMAADTGLARRLAACPADIFATDVVFWRRWIGAPAPVDVVSKQQCEEAPDLCYTKCVDDDRAQFCLNLGLALQNHRDRKSARFAEMLFAKACALGDGGGCTNRAAYIRNVTDPEDVDNLGDESARDLCGFRSFKIDCGRDGPWGCAMLGQAYLRGEGVKADNALARASFLRACELNPSFAACDFAKDYLRQMSGATP